MQGDVAYSEVNRKWKTACRIIFGSEIGEMEEYEKWLSDIGSPRAVQHDSQGREIILAVPHYSTHTKWISFEEVDFNKKYPPLGISINEIKDIDSLFEAIQDRIFYTGNIVLGNSKFVEKSTGIFESFYIYNCERSAYCKHMAYSTQATSSESMFGCNGFGSTTCCIKIDGLMYSSRCFEASKVEYSHDCYYSHNLSNCQDCMFSFNLRSKRNCIGNLQLAPAKYQELKAKLVSEMREKLVKDKRLPALADFCKSPVTNQAELRGLASEARKGSSSERPDAAPIEKAFSDTMRLIFGKPYGQIDRYGKWLNQYTAGLEEAASCASGKKLVVPEYVDFHLFPRHRLLSEEEASYIGERLPLAPAEVEQLNLENAGRAIAKIAYFCPSWTLGTVKNAIDAVINIESANCYRNVLNINSKYSAFGYWARDSDHMFGGNEVRNSAFCVNCYHSAKLQRCFEVDASRDCSGCYYCHNCENVRDSMFCFNVKNLRYAIGNVEMGREKYLTIKEKVLSQLNDELGEKCSISRSIFRLLQKKN